MKMPSPRMIIFVLVVILFVGLFYSIVKPSLTFVEGATEPNQLDIIFNDLINEICRNMEPASLDELKKSGKIAEMNNSVDSDMKVILNSNLFNNFNIVTDTNKDCFTKLFCQYTPSNKKSFSAVIDKIISVLGDIKYTYLQTPDNCPQTSASNNASNETAFVKTVSGSRG